MLLSSSFDYLFLSLQPNIRISCCKNHQMTLFRFKPKCIIHSIPGGNTIYFSLYQKMHFVVWLYFMCDKILWEFCKLRNRKTKSNKFCQFQITANLFRQNVKKQHTYSESCNDQFFSVYITQFVFIYFGTNWKRWEKSW